MFLDSELCRSGFTVYNNYMYYACTLLCAVSISVDVAAIVVCYTPVTSLTHKNDDGDVDVLKALVTSQLGVAACSGVVSDASDTEMED